jgi:HPt (histidine-containing phosphotransfer) domain-containing protein
MDERWPSDDEKTPGVLDERLLMEAASDDRVEAAALMTLFFRLAAHQFVKMREAADAGERSSLARTAHQAAGGAATCGFGALASALHAMETIASSPAGDLTAGLERAGRELERARRAASSFLGEDGTS